MLATVRTEFPDPAAPSRGRVMNPLLVFVKAVLNGRSLWIFGCSSNFFGSSVNLILGCRANCIAYKIHDAEHF